MWIIIALLGAGALLVGMFLRAAGPEQGPSPVGGLSRPLFTLGALLLIFSPFVSAAVQVPPGHRGVIAFFGSVESRILSEGLSFIVPVAERVVLVDVRVQPHNFREIEAASREYQTVRLTGTMNFHLDPAFVNDLYQRVGLDFADKVIDPAFNDFIKEVMPNYSINDILPKRDEIRKRAQEKLGENLGRYHIVIDDIYIANIAFSPQYTQAIEDKQTQQQRVETERQILAQREIQAQQQVAQAKGEADSTVVRAVGQAEANQRLTESLSQEVIQWEYVRRIADKIQVMLLPSGQSFLLDIGGLMGGAAPAEALRPPPAQPAPRATPQPQRSSGQ